MIIFRWLCRGSIFCLSCQWSIDSWSNQRIDSNRIIYLTIKIDSTIRIESTLRIFWTLRIDSTFEIDSTDILNWFFCRVLELFSNSKTFIASNSEFLIPRWLVSSDLRRSCRLRRTYPSGAKFSGLRFGVISFLLQLGYT